METLRGLSGVSPWYDWKGFTVATHRFDGWNNSCLFCQWRRWECWCTLLFVSCLWPISSLRTKSQLLSPFKTSSVQYSQLTGEEQLVPHSDTIHLYLYPSTIVGDILLCVYLSYLCLNVCTPRPRRGSSGHIATCTPILYLMSALSHL